MIRNNVITRLLVTITVFILFAVKATAANAPQSFADLVEKLNPAVVNISTTQTIEGSSLSPFGQFFHFEGPNGDDLGELPELFKKFYGEPFGNLEGNKQKRETTSLGSGFVISEEGYIVTNHHVIDKADEITIIFNDDTEATAKVVGSDAKTDIAVLKIETDKKLPFVKFGNSDKARVGDWVIAIGNPFGLGGSVSAGIISARARDINAGPFDDFIQTDAAINRGNSGGPMFNVEGEVIGVNSAIFSPSGGNVGIGFAVPSNLAEPVINQLIETGHIERGWLGVKIQTVTDEIAESIGMKDSNGALVVDVQEKSPADKGGLKAGDVIISFDGKNVETMRRLPRIVAETPVGKKVPVVVWRNGEKKTVIVTIALLDESDGDASKSADGKSDDTKDSKKADVAIAGIGIQDITKAYRDTYNIDKDIKGVVITDIDHKSEASSKPIKAGDVITAINQTQVNSVKEAKEVFDAAVDKKRKSVLLLINRGGDTLFIAVPIEKK
ncbi:MAG: DegQ family serine endoprotease [Rickettsiales bacterium]|nr:DegQ family serine endoprotease [Pseudomonadota bacterium]MDA0966424.1 DegQ family serine endoprotease [Pseudomonadota bacterium]MDG4543286.1 DegQ family serine endoprotease [Rickettsiales bacterium]MDG4545552.1 DegQ family serine endoprotease [Rickettsiales bacterium]MDG4548001.1 DegQ family serine endoprotease [Rickettsiales bacterium]